MLTILKQSIVKRVTLVVLCVWICVCVTVIGYETGIKILLSYNVNRRDVNKLQHTDKPKLQRENLVFV